MTERFGGVKMQWQRQVRRLALWCPVLMALGIVGWFEFVRLPIWCAGLAGVSAVGLWIMCHRRAPAFGILVAGIAWVAVGFAAAELREQRVAAPVLHGEISAEIAGRIIARDRSRSGAIRVTLDRVAIAGLHPAATPARVRVSLTDWRGIAPIGGDLSVAARLSPPPGPAEPGAFDFSRQAYFARLGAVGFARSPPRIAPPQGPLSGPLALTELRMRIADDLIARLGAERGGVAAALTVGEKSGIPKETLQALRDSGLAHLLAISGLHIGLMSALVYVGLRSGFALLPGAASTLPIKKVGAAAALLAAGAYLLLAGAGVATQRAFVMVAVAFIAVFLDRPAVTMRGLAVAATLVLLVTPESLFSAGFQMSFAATAALVAAYEATRGWWVQMARAQNLALRLAVFVAGLAMTSAVAGFATAPIAMFHFNRMVVFGLLANVLAAPIMSFAIMPAIILTALLAPFGATGIGLLALDHTIGAVIAIGGWVAAMDGAVRPIAALGGTWLPLVAIGGVWLVIWRGPLRLLGLPILATLALGGGVSRPDILVSKDARLIGFRMAGGDLALSREASNAFSATLWLRRDGDMGEQSDAYLRGGWTCMRATCAAPMAGGERIILQRGRVNQACRPDDVIIIPKFRVGPDLECTAIDMDRLQGRSSLALYRTDEGYRIAEASRYRPRQYWRINATSLPWISTRPGP